MHVHRRQAEHMQFLHSGLCKPLQVRALLTQAAEAASEADLPAPISTSSNRSRMSSQPEAPAAELLPPSSPFAQAEQPIAIAEVGSMLSETRLAKDACGRDRGCQSGLRHALV